MEPQTESHSLVLRRAAGAGLGLRRSGRGSSRGGSQSEENQAGTTEGMGPGAVTFDLEDWALLWETRHGVGTGGRKRTAVACYRGTSHSGSRGSSGLDREASHLHPPPRPAPLPGSLHQSCKSSRRGFRGATLIKLTVTLEALPRQAPEQGPTVLTEGGALVIVDLKSVWHVDFEPLLVELKGKKNA